MSTLDQAFIRAYTKDADQQGTAEPGWYRPETEVGAAAAPPPAAAVSAQPVVRSPLDCLYAEGMWYRIEPRQPAARQPHVSAQAFAPRQEPRSREYGPRSEARSAAPATPPPLPKTRTSASSRRPVDPAPDSPSEESAARGLPSMYDFTSQFVISASAGFIASAEPPALQAETSPTDSAGAALTAAPWPESMQEEWSAAESVPLEEPELPRPVARPKEPSPESAASAELASQRPGTDDRRTADRQQTVPHATPESGPPRVKPVAPRGAEVATDEVAIRPQHTENAETPGEAATTERARLDATTGGNVPAPHFAIGEANRAKSSGGRQAAAKTPSSAVVPESEPRTSGGEPAATRAANAADENLAQRADADLQRERSRREFHPAWEVDALAWPELVDRLLRRETRRFTLLTEKLAEIARAGRNVIAVTSPQRDAGRTTLSLCLARRAAAMGLKVALVDADFGNPQLAQRLRINPTCGWHDTVAADLPMTEAAVASMQDGVTLLPLRLGSVGRPDDEAQLDASAVADLIDRLSKCFDLVLFDMEPVEPDDEPPPQSAELHEAVAGLLVYDTASQQQLDSAVSQLRAAGIETIGAVENFSRPEVEA